MENEQIEENLAIHFNASQFVCACLNEPRNWLRRTKQRKLFSFC